MASSLAESNNHLIAGQPKSLVGILTFGGADNWVIKSVVRPHTGLSSDLVTQSFTRVSIKAVIYLCAGMPLGVLNMKVSPV